LSIPDWPPENALNDDYATSPISSPGIYTPGHSDSWNFLDSSFKDAIRRDSFTPSTAENSGTSMTQYPTSVATSNWKSNWTQGFEQQPDTFSCSPLALMSEHILAQEVEEEDHERIYGYSPSATTETTPQSPRKPAWGSPKESHRSFNSSKSEKHSSRNKKKERGSSSSKSSSKGHQLRSTKPGQRISYADECDPAPEDKAVRTSHNVVEKQYRNRLNGQFSTLLGSLPSDVVSAEVGGVGKGDSDGAEKKVSKAEVLVLAKQHIETLEKSKRKLEEDKRALLVDVQRLKGAWVSMGGEVMP
jgi:hypothetical protein